jgi:hypothetical protein
MTTVKFGMEMAVKEHLLEGHPLTQLESITLFGLSLLSRTISRMRKDGWVIKSQRVPYAKALNRVNQFAQFTPPKNLPVRDVYLTEYWVQR